MMISFIRNGTKSFTFFLDGQPHKFSNFFE